MTHYQLVASNKIRSFVIISLFVIFVASVMSAFVYLTGNDISFIPLIVIFSSIGAVTSYWFSDQIVLGLSGAKPANRNEWFDFYTTAENLAIGAQVPTPKLYVIEDTAMNAFATGRDPKHAAICATTGLLHKLDRSEIEAVMAHELAHITSYDTRLMTIVSVLVGSVLLMSDWFLHGQLLFGRKSDRESGGGVMAIVGLVLIILSPIIAQLIQLAVSRSREFAADAQAVAYTKNPQGLIDALTKLTSDREPLEAANRGTAHLYIVNPLRATNKSGNAFSNLFATHPPLEQRIAALQKLLGQG